MTDQKTHSPSPKPVYLRFGDWYVLHQGESEIKAFQAYGQKVVLVMANMEGVIDMDIKDFIKRLIEWAIIDHD